MPGVRTTGSLSLCCVLAAWLAGPSPSPLSAAVKPWPNVPDPAADKAIGPAEHEDPDIISRKWGIVKGAAFRAMDLGAYSFFEPDLPKENFLELPHVDWATPLAGRKLRVLHLLADARTAMEVRARLDADHRATSRQGIVRLRTYDLSRQTYLDATAIELKRIGEALADGPWDAIVADPTLWDVGEIKVVGGHAKDMTDEQARTLDAIGARIADLVVKGCGLVYLYTPYRRGRVDPLLSRLGCSGTESASTGEGTLVKPDREHYLGRWLSGETLPKGLTARALGLPAEHETFLSIEGRGNRLHPYGVAFTHGKGRVVLHLGDFPPGSGSTPVVTRVAFDPMPLWEAAYALVARSILWAARAEPAVRLRLETEQTVEESQPVALQYGVEGARADEALRVEITLVDDWGETAVTRADVPDPTVAARTALPDAARGGVYFAQLVLRNAKGESLDFASALLTVRRANPAIRVEADKRVIDEPGEIVAHITVSNAAPGTAAELVVELRDNFDRVADRVADRIQLAGKDDVLDVRVDGRRASTAVCELQARLVSGGRVISRGSCEVFFPRFGLPRDFVSINYGGGVQLRELRPTGAYLWKTGRRVTNGYANPTYLEQWQRLANMSYIANCPFMQHDSARGGATNAIFEQAETMPYRADQRRQKFDRLMAAGATFGIANLNLGDETSLAGRKQEADRHPFVLKAFRQHLQALYGSLDNLNASWQTAFESWDAVQPAYLRDVQGEAETPWGGKTHLASWYEFRVFMNDLYAEYWQTSDRWCKEVSPALGLGVCRFYRDSGAPNGGGDLSRCLPYVACLIENVPYTAAYPSEMFNSFVGGGIYLGSDPWISAISGGWGVWHYVDCNHIDQRLGYRHRAINTALADKPVQEGVGRLLIEAERLHDGVALLYSFDSEIIGAALSERVFKDSNNNGFSRSLRESSLIWERILGDAGLRHRWVSEKQVVEGCLKDYRLLLLPHVFVLSDDALRAMADFVSGGGIVVADILPAVYDGHGNPRPDGGLKDVLGVSVNLGTPFEGGLNPIHHLPLMYSVGAMKDTPLSDFQWLGWVDSRFCVRDVRASDQATLLGCWFAGDQYKTRPDAAAGDNTLPAVVVNRFGKGTGLYLGFMPENYAPPTEDRDWRLLARELARLGGIEPAVRVWNAAKREETDCAVWRYRHGGTEYVGLIRSAFRWTDDTRVRLEWTVGRRHVYDVRHKTYLGELDGACEVDCTSDTPALLAFCGYRLTALDLDAPSGVSAGKDLGLTLRLKAEGGEPGRHVVHVAVFGPDGTEREWYGRNIVMDSTEARYAVPLAFNDPAGMWTVRAVDAMTGLTAERKVMVK